MVRSFVAAAKAAGAQAVAIPANLTTAGAVEKLFADALTAVGKPDLAINTVGCPPRDCAASPCSSCATLSSEPQRQVSMAPLCSCITRGTQQASEHSSHKRVGQEQLEHRQWTRVNAVAQTSRAVCGGAEDRPGRGLGWSTRPALLPARGVRHAACGVRHAACGMRHAACGMRVACRAVEEERI